MLLKYSVCYNSLTRLSSKYRRIVGVAHVEDFESITDTATRAKCERQALDVAKMIMKERRRFEAITGAVSAIQEFHK